LGVNGFQNSQAASYLPQPLAQGILVSENKSDILFDLSCLPAGIYTVNIANITNAQKHTQKIIIH